MLKLHEVEKTFFAGTPRRSVTRSSACCLEIEEGSFVIVIGTNGSGKIDAAQRGRGHRCRSTAAPSPLTATTSRAGRSTGARASIGRVFQNPFSGTAPTMTVAENLALAVPARPTPRLGWALPARRARDARSRR